MKLQIFDVEHGACALLTADNYARLMIDCGHNGGTGWSPGRYLLSKGISQLEMLQITNYDEDHVSGINDLLDNVHVGWLGRNPTVDARTLHVLKSEFGMGPGIERLAQEMEFYFRSSAKALIPPDFLGVHEHLEFYNRYPYFDDENNLSMAVFLNCHGVGVMFTGDLEKEGWLVLLERQDFRYALRRTRVFVASHHGRISGWCEDVFRYCSPFYTVISDKAYAYDTQQTIPLYRSVSKGGPFRGEQRHVLTTRKDGMITFSFEQDRWGPF